MAGELITADAQLEWHGVAMGPGTDIGLTGITGWYGLPGARRITFDRPGRHGGLPGELRAGERVVEAQLLFHDVGDAASFTATRRALAAALAWSENPVEEPLVVRLDGETTMVSARVLAFDLPTTLDYVRGFATGAVQWVATDPRRYGMVLRSASTKLAAPIEGGLAFPLAFPLDFGPGLAGGTITLHNNGNTPASPVFEVIGPITGPIITCQETGARLLFRDDFTIGTGQRLRIDTDTGVVMLGAANRRNELTVADWFTVPAGGSKLIRFTASSGTGSLVGFVRDAYMT